MSTPSTQTMKTASEPVDERDLPKVEAETAAEILERYDASEAATALLIDGMTPHQFFDALRQNELLEDAITFLAYGLPRREALLWGLRCVREITPEEPAKEIAAALAATDAWVTDGT